MQQQLPFYFHTLYLKTESKYNGNCLSFNAVHDEFSTKRRFVCNNNYLSTSHIISED